MSTPKDSARNGKVSDVEVHLHSVERKVNRYSKESLSSEKEDLEMIQKCLAILAATMESLTKNVNKAILFQEIDWILIATGKSEHTRDFIREIKNPVLETILMVYQQLKKDLQPLRASPEKEELAQQVASVITNIQTKHDLNNSLSVSYYQTLVENITKLTQYQVKIEQALKAYQQLRTRLDTVPFQQRGEFLYKISNTIKAIEAKPYEQDYQKIFNEQVTLEKQIHMAAVNNKSGLIKLFSKASTQPSSSVQADIGPEVPKKN